MKRVLLLSMIAGLSFSANRVQAQDGALPAVRPASVAAMFLERPSSSAPQAAAQTCMTANGCVVLGAVLTGVGIGVSGIGIAFLTRIDAGNSDDDLVVLPVSIIGGALLATGIITTGIGIYLIRRGRRLKRMTLTMGWHGAPTTHLRFRF